MLFWNIKVEVGVGRGGEGIAATAPHTEHAGDENDDDVGDSDGDGDWNIVILSHLRNWLKLSVGKSSDAWKIVCSRR